MELRGVWGRKYLSCCWTVDEAQAREGISGRECLATVLDKAKYCSLRHALSGVVRVLFGKAVQH